MSSSRAEQLRSCVSLMSSRVSCKRGRRQRLSTCANKQKVDVVVVGGAVMDIVGRPAPGLSLSPHTSSPGSVMHKVGGVGRNMAEALARLHVPTMLLTAVGDDAAGSELVARMRELAPWLHVEGMQVLKGVKHRTATYLALLDERNDLVAAVADMDIFKELNAEVFASPPWLRHIAQAQLVACDGNLQPEAFEALSGICHDHRVPLLFEPTSLAKCTLPILHHRQGHLMHSVTFAKPNVKELAQMAITLGGHTNNYAELEAELAACKSSSELKVALTCAMEEVLTAMAAQGSRGWRDGQKHLLVTMGAKGVAWGSIRARRLPGRDVEVQVLEVDKVEPMVECTGAGDTFAATVTAALLRSEAHKLSFEECVRMGMAAARRSVRSSSAVPKSLQWEALLRDVRAA